MKSNFGASNVISLAAVRAARETPEISDVEQYWHRLRQDRLMPARDDINPRDLGTLLPHTFLMERIAPGMGRIRVAGSHLGKLLGMDARSMPLSVLFTAPARRELADMIEALFSEPAMVQANIGSTPGIGRKSLSGSMVMLPLRAYEGPAPLALGALSMTGEIGRAPRRLDIRSHTIRPLLTDMPSTPTPQFDGAC